MAVRGSDDRFPAPVFKETVLAPLFETAKTRFVAAFRRVDRAHCVMLAETGVLARGQATAIARALADIEASLDLANATYTGEVEDLFFLIEGALRERLGPDVAGRLHTGRSRNDIDHTLFRMALKERIDTALVRMRALLEAAIAKAETEIGTTIVAYTHGQPAQPTTFGHYLSAYIEVLIGDIERLAAARATVDQCPMGAGAITTTGFALDRARMADLLGFARIRTNSYGSIAAVDYVTAPYAALRVAMIHLGRLVQDLQFWSAFEVGQLRVPDGFVQISSIMPQKRNPVPIEHARLLASLAGGRAETALSTMHNTPFTDMNDSEGEVQAASHAAFVDAGRAIDLVAGLIRAVTIDAARVAANLDRSCATITELADTLVREAGLSFRQAHEIAGATARAVVAAGSSLREAGYAPFARAYRAATGTDTTLDAARFATVVSPAHFIAVRRLPGGPAPEPMRAALGEYRARAAAFAAEAMAIAEREAARSAELDRAFAELQAE
jgi:argininosuccinate lyase